MFNPNHSSGIQFHFRYSLQFLLRNYYSSFTSHFASHDPQSFLKSVRQQCQLGFTNPQIPLSIFNHLNSLRPRPSVIVFNQLLTAMVKIRPHPPLSTVAALFNHLEVSGLRPDAHSVTILANCYCRLGRVDFAFSLLGKRIKLGYPPDVVIITTLLNGLILSDKLHSAVLLLDKIIKLGIQPNLVTHGALFKGLCRIGDNAGAMKLLRDMERKAPFKPDVVIYSTLIDSHCKDRLLPQALALFKEMKSKGILPDVVTYNSLIRGCFSLGQWDEGEDLWAEMLSNDVAPNIVTYSTLIDIHCKDGNVEKARAIFESMSKRGLRPNIITYNTLLDGYCLRGEMAEAENVLDIMVKDGIDPNVVTFSTLINGYCKSKQVHKAMVLFKDMRLRRVCITPNAVTYTTLIDALCKDNNVKIAYQKFEEMKDRGVAPNVVTYNSLLDGLLKNAEIDRGMSLFREMVKDGVAPDMFTYSTIINGLCVAGRPTEALEVFSTLVVKGLQPDVPTYTTMIKVLCKQGLLTDATELLKKMENTGFSPNERTYNTIIKGFLNADDVSKALDYLRVMRSHGFAADNKTTSLFMELVIHPNVSEADKALLDEFFFSSYDAWYCGRLQCDEFEGKPRTTSDDVDALVSSRKKPVASGKSKGKDSRILVDVNLSDMKGVHPDVATYNTTIKVLCLQGQLTDATALLKKMEDTRCSPNERTYNTIIRGFLNADDVASALEYLRIMRCRQYAADANTTSLFVDLLTDTNVSDADKTLLQNYFFELQST